MQRIYYTMVLATDTPKRRGIQKKNALNGYHCSYFGRNEHQTICFLLHILIGTTTKDLKKLLSQVLFIRNHLNTRPSMYKVMLFKFTCHSCKVPIVIVVQKVFFSSALFILYIILTTNISYPFFTKNRVQLHKPTLKLSTEISVTCS